MTPRSLPLKMPAPHPKWIPGGGRCLQMITTFMTANELHAAYKIHQSGMSIRATGFCKVDDKVGDGLYQVPDWAFDGTRAKYGDTPVCGKCAEVVRGKKEPPK